MVGLFRSLLLPFQRAVSTAALACPCRWRAEFRAWYSELFVSLCRVSRMGHGLKQESAACLCNTRLRLSLRGFCPFSPIQRQALCADRVWPASLHVTYCVAEWQVPCGISTELTASVCNLVQSTLLPGEELCVTLWPQFKDRTNDTAPESPCLNILHHT